ncbi:MAG: hypothetical protein CVU90_10075 [Firmicutes bacterium HGW-Firmicutes-15]|nr:MAG: hypothetical protein CVU90_10075 [Firmicutes bacterium HGW-Firmicutes-15]
MNPEELTRHLNFEYYMISSPRELEAFSKHPVYLEPDVFQKMIAASRVLFGLVDRLVPEILHQPLDHSSFLLPDFPFREQILHLPIDLAPFFWARYDAFERAEGGIFFSEFNYDKPCAQREIMVSNFINPQGNPNQHFAQKFREGLARLWAEYGAGNHLPTVGILVDPNHYEETHLAFLYLDLIKPLGYSTLLLGGQNLNVTNDGVTAFGQALDIILRQYPTEFSNEVHDYPKLLELIARRKVLMVNDPRAIVPQAKSLFAYLWHLYDNKSSLLTDAERTSIRETIPYTRMFTPVDMAELESKKERWVVKPVFGRYSEGVHIGAMMNKDEWQIALKEVCQGGVPHVMQEFIPIRRRVVKSFNGHRYEDTIGFGNFGIYFTLGEFTGICARWSSDYLSQDDMAWFSPVGVRHTAIPSLNVQISSRSEAEHHCLWNKISEQAAFQFNYTASYTGDWESFILEPVRISRTLYHEVIAATEGLGRVFVKTRIFLQNNLVLFTPLLGIPECLQSLVAQDEGEWLSLLGRFDWAIDRHGSLRLLELNTDTPAGLESVALNSLIHPLCPNSEDPNRGLLDLLANQYRHLLSRSPRKSVKTLGLVGCPSAEEDWFQLMLFGEILRSQVDELILGDISGLSLKDGHINLYGQHLDALYRHYPLDWMAENRQHQRLIPGLKELYMINPSSALIPQSKAFLAIVWQLLQEGFYLPEEADLLQRYVVPTYLNWPEKPCVIKPYWEREGQGVVFSNQITSDQISGLAEQDLVYQELVDIGPVDITIRNTYSSQFQVAYPILGAFLAGDQFGGLYTRLGARITDRYAVVAPTFVEVS